MKNQENIFDLFERVPGIEPSPDWDAKLWQKMNSVKHRQRDAIAGRYILAAIAIMLLINVFSFSKNFIGFAKQDNLSALQNIASEFLITTSSSKY